MRRYAWFFVLFSGAVFMDQLTKTLVDRTFELYETREILGSFLQLTYIRNSGAAFGLSFGSPILIFAANIIVTVLFAYLFIRGSLRPRHVFGQSAVVLVFSGAIGNIIDRIRLGFEVIDFIDMGIGVHRWPVYNFADIYVTVGMAILFVIYSLQPEKTETLSSTVVE